MTKFRRRELDPTNSEMLAAWMPITCGRLYSAYRRLWADPDVGTAIPDFLILMHQIVRASVPLMTVAHAVAVERAKRDGVSQQVVSYLATHIVEERNHDEWLLQDLETAGISREAVLGRTPSAHVAALVGAQYYWIHHHDPVALLGYIRLLEGNPPSGAHIERLQKQSRLPLSLFRTYRMHGELDPHHLEELDSFLDSLPLTEPQAGLICTSLSHTAHALADCIEEVTLSLHRRTRVSKAEA